jgi:hypothetical protein
MDTLSINSLGGETLQLGLRFLYSQAGELLKRRRERRDESSESQISPGPGVDVLARPPSSLAPDFAALGKLEPQIRELRSLLSDYADEIEVVDPKNTSLIEVTQALRKTLEVVLRCDLTFRGERRERPALDVESQVDVGEVAGYVTGVLARAVGEGRIRSRVSVDSVQRGGSVTGVVLGEDSEAG